MSNSTLLDEVVRIISEFVSPDRIKVFKEPLSVATSVFAEDAQQLLTQFKFVISPAGDQNAVWVVTHRAYAQDELQTVLAKTLTSVAISENNLVADANTAFFYISRTKQF